MGGKNALPRGGYAVPNLICYENGRPVIGEAARNRPNVIDSFKTPPEFWDEPATSGRSYDEVIHDYIAGVWQLAAAERHRAFGVRGERKRRCRRRMPRPRGVDGKGRHEAHAELVGRGYRLPRQLCCPEPNAALMSARLRI